MFVTYRGALTYWSILPQPDKTFRVLDSEKKLVDTYPTFKAAFEDTMKRMDQMIRAAAI